MHHGIPLNISESIGKTMGILHVPDNVVYTGSDIVGGIHDLQLLWFIRQHIKSL